MRFYTTPHRYSCGIDLHARTMYVCILNQDGGIVFHCNMPATPDCILIAEASSAGKKVQNSPVPYGPSP